jgi:hypothetical protein
MNQLAGLLLLGCLALGCTAQRRAPKTTDMDTGLIETILREHPRLDSLLHDTSRRIQILYTRIHRKRNGTVAFTTHAFGNPDQYFYPASTVKMPVAILALQRLNELRRPGLDRNSTMISRAAYPGQTAVDRDPTSADGRPTIAHYIKKIFLVSDNDAYNRLYEFLGQEYINQTLHRMGYGSAQIIHRLSVSLNEDQHRHTNPVEFYDTAGRLLYSQPLVKSGLVYQPRSTFLGKGYYSGGKPVSQPFDFSYKNRLTLSDLHSILRSVLFPESVPKKQRFNLTQEDYAFLHKYMSMLPRESDFPKYDSTHTDAYVKFLLYGGSGPVDSHIRIFNKVGDAYGFLTDAAYIVDHQNNVEFLLSATIHCNSDGIYNDDKYEYDELGFPFMKELGRAIHGYEVGRRKVEGIGN